MPRPLDGDELDGVVKDAIREIGAKDIMIWAGPWRF